VASLLLPPSDYVRCLDGTLMRTPSASGGRSAAGRRVLGGATSSATVSVIQRQLVDWILRAGGSAHRVRTNLYRCAADVEAAIFVGSQSTVFSLY